MEKDIIEYHFPIVFFFVEIEVNIPFQKNKVKIHTEFCRNFNRFV